ncbi:hypothetical protein EDO6_06189 [Paenibacillus xylanexedens]|nr:hypothetical protein EDO6_06189 [Paenibacillus xylanexedens]
MVRKYVQLIFKHFIINRPAVQKDNRMIMTGWQTMFVPLSMIWN